MPATVRVQGLRRPPAASVLAARGCGVNLVGLALPVIAPVADRIDQCGLALFDLLNGALQRRL